MSQGQRPNFPKFQHQKDHLQRQTRNRICSPPKNIKKSVLSDLISDVLIPFVDQIAKEITLYRSEAQLDIDGNPLIWWKAKEFSYPNLSKLAKCYLAIPARKKERKKRKKIVYYSLTPRYTTHH